MALASRLAESGFKVTAYDPMAGATARDAFKGAVAVVDSREACLDGAAAVVVTTTHPEFLALQAADFDSCAHPVVVYDPWRSLESALEGRDGIRWVPFGRECAGGANADRLAALWSPLGVG
jgi:UDP-glucose 6-dehydrogenase